MNPASHSSNINPEIAISAQDVSKTYRIWRDPVARLKAPFWTILGKSIPKSIRPSPIHTRISRPSGSRYYTDFHALDKLSFEIRRGESVAIIGRNGSGKSTLLQILAGTLTPTTGQAKVHGRVAALLELGNGFNPEFTGRENVHLNAHILGLSETEIRERFDDIAAFADIGDFIDQPVKTYSSGMTMRLAFSVIAHVDADVLIVDEALAVGDVFFVQKCMRFIRKFQERGTLLLVTHDTTSVTTLCQRAIWLHQGHAKGMGPADEIARSYLQATYAEKQGVVLFKDKSASVSKPRPAPKAVEDQRLKFINQTSLRNDLEVFEFKPDASGFGAGGAVIQDVSLLDVSSLQPLAYSVGGEQVILRIAARAHTELDRPIMGFFLMNHLGQALFGDNTFISHLSSPCPAKAGELLVTSFTFQMPYLPAGDYVFCVAIANGTQEEHVQHHWMHDALAFRSQSSHAVGGLIGLPMLDISMKIAPSPSDAHS